MTTPRTLQLLAFSIFASYCSVGFAFGDPAYSPCILNGYRVAVGLVTTFGDGTSSPGSLPPGSDAWQRIKGRHLVSLSVMPTGADKHVYTASTLNRLRREHPVKDELWIVSEQGIKLEDRRRIKAVREELAHPRK